MKKTAPKTQKVQSSQKANPEIEQLKAQLVRALADYDNLVKRTEADKMTWIKFSTEELVRLLLPVLDNLDRTIKGVEQGGKKSPWLEGVVVADKELRKILREHGIEEVPTERFDPHLHEAIESRGGPEGEILDVFQMGYILNGKLIQAAKVAVGNGS